MPIAEKVVPGELGDIDTVDGDGARVEFVEPQQQVHQRGLPRAGRTADSDERTPLPYAFELNAIALDRPGGAELSAHWTWAGNLFQESEIRRLGENWFLALRALAAYGVKPDAGGLTPSDVPLVPLTQDGIENIEAMYAND